MKKTILLAMIPLCLLNSCKEKETKTEVNQVTSEMSTETEATTVETGFEIIPISHGTLVLKWDDATIYIDPVGGKKAFDGQADPDVILITDIHGDHLNKATLDSLPTTNTSFIVPKAVAQELGEAYSPQTTILDNGAQIEKLGFTIEAIPMYNLREEALKFHPKGRGNGYVISKGGKRVYVSGDTEDIPEMRQLENIDIAFVCMNLPYTMPVESAADAVIAFEPDTVLPYHYRGTQGLSDVQAFKNKVNQAKPEIDVLVLDWYENAQKN